MIWIISHFAAEIGILATGTFVDLFLWEQTQSLQIILQHAMGVFIAMPPLLLLTAWIAEFAGNRTAWITSFLFAMSYTFVLIYTQETIVAEPLLLGLLRGAALGSLTISLLSLEGKTSHESTESTVSKAKAIDTVADLIFPPLMALSVLYFGSFHALFIFGMGAYVVALLTSLFVKIPLTDSRFNLGVALLPFKTTNPEKWLIARATFLDGIKQGIFFSLIGVIALQFTGGLEGWSIFTFGLSLLAIILDLTYTKFFSSSQSLVTSGLGAIIFTFCAVIFITNFNLVGLIFFSVGNTILGTIFGISQISNIHKLTKLETITEDTSNEYNAFTSIYQTIGSIIPIAILVYLKVSLDDPGLLEAVIIGISLIPFAVLGVMSKSYALRHATALESAEQQEKLQSLPQQPQIPIPPPAP